MRIKKFTQTPFISYEDKNMIYIEITDWDMCNPYGVEISINNETVYQANIFAADFSAMVPCVEQNCPCVVKITPFEDLPVIKIFELKVPKHWEVPLLYSSHEDLGYCAYIDKLHYESYEYLKVAMELCKQQDSFRYMIEHYWWLDAFDAYATEEEKEELKQLIATKKIELNAIHSGVHTSWENGEQLVRSMYFGCRDAKQKYGAEPKCAFFTDLSGMSWSTVSAYSKMGIKYMADFSNGFRNCEEDMLFPPLFWWKDKSGESRVLFWYQRSYRPHGLTEIWCDTKRQYPEGEFFFDQTKRYRTERWFTDKINRIGECAYEIFPLSFYDDRERPTTMLLTVCEEMNRRWKYPQFRMEVPSVFMEEIADKYGDTLPEFSGNISDQWGDFATIAPQWMAKRRSSSRMLYDAEILSCIKAITESRPYKSRIFTKAVWNMSCFDEHCWATSSKHPQKMHRYNMDKVKKGPVETTYSELKEEMEQICGQPEGKEISITNTIPQGYHGSLRIYERNRIKLLKEENVCGRNAEGQCLSGSGKEQHKTAIPVGINHQILPDESVITSSVHFESVAVQNFQSQTPWKTSKEVLTDQIETDFYKISLDFVTQKIASIIDKESGRELLDLDADFELGQFIYLNTADKTKPESGYEVPKKEEFKLYEGEVAYVVTQKGYEEQSGAAIFSQFIFYKKEKNIDIDLSYENATGLIGDFYDRYKKNYFFAFPFAIEEPQFYTELPCGEMNENSDYIPINASDFTVTQNWIAAENATGGIALYSEDMPVFHLGKIKYNQFTTRFREDKGHFYLYASSNRCNNLIYTALDDCRASYHLSVLPYTGKHNEWISVWSNQKEHKPVLGKAVNENRAYLKTEQQTIRLTGMKKAEDRDDALILRWVETAGRAEKAVIDLFFPVSKAVYAANDETDLDTVEADGTRICFNIKPYSYVILKIYGEFQIV